MENIPIIKAKDPNAIQIEGPVLFTASLLFVNHQGQYTSVVFKCPPGLYPNPEYIVKLVKEAQREALKALKLETKDLSWRLPSPDEFVKLTSGGAIISVNDKWAEPYSVKLDVNGDNEVVNDNNSN